MNAQELLEALKNMVEAYGGVHDLIDKDGISYQSDGAECAELAAREAIAHAIKGNDNA
jgi:hypothetical protein